MTRTPLDLYGEVTTADGVRYKWDANQPAKSRPLNLRFGTKIGEGFGDGGLQFPRRIDIDSPDLDLVNDVTFTGADGSIAYEGRIAALPRELGDRHTVGVTLAGHMAHAKDRKFQEVYVDRDASQWGETPIERKTALLTSGVSMGDFGFSVDQGGLIVALPNQALGGQTLAEAWYQAPPGVTISRVEYQGSTNSFPAGWTATFKTADARSAASALETYTATLNTALQGQALTTARRYVFAQIASGGSPATPAAGATAQLAKISAIGNHGLGVVTGDPSELNGFYLSDIIKNIAQRFCPLLDTSGVQTNTYVVQHCAFRDRTFPYDAFLELNKYALWHLGVWDNKTLTFRPYDLTDYDWEIRTDDPGTTFSPQGPSTEDLFNGIAVTYTDPLTGVTDVLTPDVYSDLADPTSSNPWNRRGISHWDEITLSTPTLQPGALNLGQAALANRNRPRTPGTITVRGYIRDRAGNPQPVWKVRAGDTIAITNFNDIIRLIVETDYDDTTKQLNISVDKPFALLDAYLDRVGNALQAAGLA